MAQVLRDILIRQAMLEGKLAEISQAIDTFKAQKPITPAPVGPTIANVETLQDQLRALAFKVEKHIDDVKNAKQVTEQVLSLKLEAIVNKKLATFEKKFEQPLPSSPPTSVSEIVITDSCQVVGKPSDALWGPYDVYASQIVKTEIENIPIVEKETVVPAPIASKDDKQVTSANKKSNKNKKTTLTLE